jgi:hypothetical protein
MLFVHLAIFHQMATSVKDLLYDVLMPKQEQIQSRRKRQTAIPIAALFALRLEIT